jgi:hypothetical protein
MAATRITGEPNEVGEMVREQNKRIREETSCSATHPFARGTSLVEGQPEI